MDNRQGGFRGSQGPRERSGGFRGSQGPRERSGGFRRDQDPKDMHKAVCADCGNECEVPFKPSGDRPVYCRDCYRKHKKF